MKKLGREPEKLETLNLFSLLQTDDGTTLYDPANRQSFLSQVDSGLTRALDSEATLHGIRVQAMFQGMVASFDYVRLVKEEDAGNCYYQIDEEIRVPDFRVVTTKGESWLIETKNHFSKDPMKRYRIRKDDVQALRRYAEIVGAPLRFAVYWAHRNHWTLNDPDRFTQNGKYAEIEFLQAMKQNEMAILGDYTIGTTYPLSLKLLAAMDQPRTLSPGGVVSMRIGQVEIRSADVLLEDKIERNIALYLMMYGKWEYDGGHIELDEAGLPVAAIHTSSPEEITPNQGFEMVGSISSLYSQLYNSLTLEGGQVSRLNLKEPTSLAPVIPREWKKKQLPMWRFVIHPNFE
jgi:Holliday junction resolvase